MITIVIPIKEANSQSRVDSLFSASCFAELELDDQQKLQNTNFLDAKETWQYTASYLVVNDPEADYSEYKELGIKVLLTTPLATVEDVYESFMFRELQELD